MQTPRKSFDSVTLHATGDVRFLGEDGRRFTQWEVEYPGAVIGRSQAADVQILAPARKDGSQISRRHCSLEPDRGRWWIADWRSKFGTIVRSRDREILVPPEQKVAVANGDYLVLAGYVTLRIDIRRPASDFEGSTGGVIPAPAAFIELPEELRTFARVLTRGWRTVPSRPTPTGPAELMRRMSIARGTVYQRKERILRHPRIHDAIAERGLDPRDVSWSDLAHVLLAAYPELGEPNTSEEA